MATAAEALSELELLESEGLTPAELASAKAAVADTLNDSSTTEALLGEIKQLGANALAIDKCFHSAYVAFTEVDGAGFNFPEKLAPQWKVLKDRWTKLIWSSRDTATKTAVELEYWSKVIIPTAEEEFNNPDYEPSEQVAYAKDVIDRFLKRGAPAQAEGLVGEGGGHSEEFKQLKGDVLIFKTKFDGFTTAAKQQLNAQIASIKQSISSITAEIQQCDAMVSRLGRCLGFTIFGTVVAAGISLFAFGILGPLVAVGILIAGAVAAIAKKKSLIEYTRRSQNLKAQLRAKEAELRGLESKLEKLKRCEALLEAQKSCIDDIGSRLGSFANIWAAMRADAISLKDQLENVTTAELRGEFRRSLDLAKATSGPLLKGLKTYATQVDDAGLSR